MTFLSVKQIARRSIFARNALYQRASGQDAAPSPPTRVLHLLLLLAVLHQLISSQFISRPLPGEAPSTLYSLHEYIGIASLGVVFAFWLWTLLRHGETKLAKLVPWLSGRGIMAVIRDGGGQFKAIRHGKVPEESEGALASAVHGMGLLVVSAMAVTGTVYFFARGSGMAHYALEMHSLLANLVWAYLIGHASVAVLHHLLGSEILRRMFWIGRGITITTPRRTKARTKSETIGA